MMQSESINELAAALSLAQGAMTNAVMNRINPHFKSQYADLSSVIDAIRGPLSQNGLAVTQVMEIREGGMVLRTMLAHKSGQWIASEYPLPATARPQEMGSAQTYARRYSLAALICNAADEDDDANSAETQKQKINSRGHAPPKPAPNVMLHEPPQPEPDTAASEPAPAPSSPSPAGAGKPNHSLTDLDTMLAVAAEEGEVQLKGSWETLPATNDQKKMLKAALDKRHKPRAAAVDAAKEM
jgi:hypothetical protein